MSVPISNIPMMRITPSTGAAPATPAQSGSGTEFGNVLRSAVGSALDAGHEAEAQSMKAITQGGNVTEVATALSRAELTLQTATAVRDRMLQAYQDIMRIQI
jgi:flagellar hook-basal body complex protein FliE